MSTIVGTNIEVTNIKFDSDTTSMIISNTGQITAQGEGTATTNLQQGLAKVFCHWNSTSTISNGFNVSSIDDDGTGDWDLNFTNNFSNSESIATAMPDNSFQSSNMCFNTTTGATTSDITVYGVITTGANKDVGTHVAIHGDLA